jgi:hypothetical protein
MMCAASLIPATSVAGVTPATFTKSGVNARSSESGSMSRLELHLDIDSFRELLMNGAEFARTAGECPNTKPVE